MSQSTTSPDQANPITLTGSEIKTLNHSFTDAGVKYLAMFTRVYHRRL